MNTFIDKIDAVFEEMKGEMIRLFGDHTSIHNAAKDAQDKVMQAASEHFPPAAENSGEVQKSDTV